MEEFWRAHPSSRATAGHPATEEEDGPQDEEGGGELEDLPQPLSLGHVGHGESVGGVNVQVGLGLLQVSLKGIDTANVEGQDRGTLHQWCNDTFRASAVPLVYSLYKLVMPGEAMNACHVHILCK